MEDYVHKVHYYETDKMGIVHHSNYIRWMEEARVAMLDRLGVGFAKMEALGIYSPVVGVQCRFHRPHGRGPREGPPASTTRSASACASPSSEASVSASATR